MNLIGHSVLSCAHCFMPAPEYSIGLDLGGTNLRAAAIGRDGALQDSVAGKTAYSAGREAIVGDMVDAIVTLRERCGKGWPARVCLRIGL